MKKAFLSILLCVVLFLNVTPAFAEYDKPILFRNIPWGTSYPEVKETFPDSLRMENLKYCSWYSSLNELMLKGTGEGLAEGLADSNTVVAYAEPKFSNFWGEYLYPLKDIKVAGYDLENMHMIFTFIPEDGKIIKTTSHTALIYAEYMIKNPYNADPADIVIDLRTKLSSIYGQSEASQETTLFESTTYHQELWLGTDGTIVSLVHEKYTNNALLNWDHVYIRYSFKGANNLVNTAIETEKMQNQLSVEGL